SESAPDGAADADEPEAVASSEQAVNATLTLPDWDGDGDVDGSDAVAYLGYYGIQIDTHRLTDDLYNDAVELLPRRPWDNAVKTVSEGCLQSMYGMDAT